MIGKGIERIARKMKVKTKAKRRTKIRKSKKTLSKLWTKGIILVGLIWNLLITNASGYDQSPYSLASKIEVYQQPGNGTGGTPLDQQPKLALLDSFGRIVNTTANSDYDGKFIYARFMASKRPDTARYAILMQEGTDTNLENPKAEIIDGWANFTGIYVTDLADGFEINFFSLDFGYQIDSELFNNVLGPPHEMIVITQPGTATGGEAFKPQPKVGIVDRGGNPVDWVNSGTVNVSLCAVDDGEGCVENPGGNLLLTEPSSRTEVDIVGGQASFAGLAIDVAGFPYQLIFKTSFDQVPDQVITSNNFTVGIGRAVEIRMETPVTGARGGIPFEGQPSISVRDQGGNIVVENSAAPPYSEVQMYLSNNPTAALLSSEANASRTILITDGIANCTDFQVDKIGQGYQIKFTAVMRTVSGEEYSIYNESEPFDVTLGNPTTLVIGREIGGAYAGGLPFHQQPIVQLVDGGGNVFDQENTAVVTATLVESPTGFPLLGEKQTTFFRGTARFRSLKLNQIGEGYIIEFTSTVDSLDLAVNLTFQILPSTEYEIMADEPNNDDQYGYAVSIYDNTLLVGAPSESRAIQEIQRVTTTADDAVVLTNEVQRVKISGDHRVEIQEIKSCGYGGSSTSLDGYFTLTYNGQSSRPLRFDIHQLVLQSYLEADIPEVGVLTVEKEDNTECDSQNNYVWTIYFTTAEGEIHEFVPNFVGETVFNSPDPTTFYYGATDFDGMNSSSTATNISVTAETLVDSPVIDGKFRLVVGGDGTPLGESIEAVETQELDYFASALEVKTAIESAVRSLNATLHADIYSGFNLVDVSRTGPDEQRGYTWDITFPATREGVFDWRELSVNSSSLEGLNVKAKVTTEVPGTAPLDGKFRLWFKGAGPSDLIDYDESASSFETKLKGLPTIDDVSVTRSSHSLGHTWTVTFLATRTRTEYGYEEDGITNTPPLKADTFRLSGTGARVVVEYSYSVDDVDTFSCKSMENFEQYDENTEPEDCDLLEVDQFLLPNDRPVMGKAGKETGAAYVVYFDQDASQWLQAAQLKGSDSTPYDNFGFSVAYDNTTTTELTQSGVAVVGSPHASYEGSAEQQVIVCTADSGQLGVQFRTKYSSLVAWDVTAPDLEAAIESTPSITDVTVVYYKGSLEEANILATSSGDALCQPSTGDPSDQIYALVTFVYPDAGDLPMLVPVTMDPQIKTEPLLFDSTAPIGQNYHRYGQVTIDEVTKGTILGKVSGEDGYNVGAAYVFLPEQGAFESPDSQWSQDAKLLASDGIAGDQFGFAVAAQIDTIVVGAPLHDYDQDGENLLDSAGAIYVYTRDGYHGGEVGVWTQSQKLTVPDREAGDKLGSVIVLKGNTIFASALGKNDGAGKVYVFKRTAISLKFRFDQALSASDGQPGDNFGSSLAADENTIIIGAEHADGPSAEDEKEEPIYTAGGEYAQARARVSSNGAGLINCGKAYSYTRISHVNTFQFHQILWPRTPRAHARFGHSVALERDLLLVTEQERYVGPLASRRYIYEVKTEISEEAKAKDPSTQLGNLFALTWRNKFTGVQDQEDVRVAVFSTDAYEGSGVKHETYKDRFEPFQTQWMQANVSAEEMQARIDQDLDAGDIIVTRTDSDENGGHTWVVTFAEISADGGKAGTIPLLGAINKLSGGGDITITLIQEPAPYIHGETHMYKRKPSETGQWSEHAILRPEMQQDGDLFGSVVSMRGRFAAVGAPNRDAFEISGVNGGGVYVFDMGFANIQFGQETYTASEDAGTADITISRCDPTCQVGIAPAPSPLPADFGMDEENKIQFVLSDGTARSRQDCLLDSENSNECLWLDADSHAWDENKIVPELVVDIPLEIPGFISSYFKMPFYTSDASKRHSPQATSESVHSKYDFRAQSDYVPSGGQIEFGASETAKSFQVVITNDEVHESPDETVNLLLYSAGMRPVPGGDYWSTLTIEDDGDGGVGIHDTYEQFFADEPAAYARYGSATSIAGDISVSSSPFEPFVPDNNADPTIQDAGAVYIYRRSLLGVWDLEQKINSPNATTSGRFGLSLQTRDLGPHRLIIGAPGESPPTAYIYIRVADDLLDPAPANGPGTWELEGVLELQESYIGDPRCTAELTRGSCRNGHHPINQDSFYAGENSVAIHNNFAIVGAKGLESVFVFRLKQQFRWYFFQMLKSSDYKDEMFPENSIHSKVFVTRPLFGSSVAIHDDTLVVGATLEENERYEDPGRKTNQDVGLTCEDAGFRTTQYYPQVYQWKLNEFGNVYSWDFASDEEEAAFLIANDNVTLQTKVTCTEVSSVMIEIKTNGIPDHPIGTFPLPNDSLFSEEPDNPNSVKEHDHVFQMRRFPNITTVNPVSILQDETVLPPGIIGYALNGVPFLNPLSQDGDDSTQVGSPGFPGSVPDLCNGVASSFKVKRNSKAIIENVYGYKRHPICLYDQPPEISGSVPRLETGRLRQLEFDKDSVSNPNPGQRSPKIGYALDGFAIYGPFAEDGNIPTDLDACNGRVDSELGYIYHTTPWKAPYIIGCFRGTLSFEVPPNVNPFPEFHPGANRNRDLSFYGRGAAYVYLLKELNGTDYPAPELGGMDLSPKADPYDGFDPVDAWFEHTKLTPGDPERGDRFGHAVALDKDQLLVSAYREAAKARSTWDFETGDLRGWTQTGTAFANQPTFGDNTAHRNIYGDSLISTFRDYERETYHGSSNREGTRIDIFEDIEGWDRTVLYGPSSTHVDNPISITLGPHELREAMFGFVPGRSKSCKHKGRFWVGTFENRPATWDNETNQFVASEVEGSTQGDGPQGSLTSDAFPIYGTKISFRLGGGCDIDKEYIELLVDGVSVKRETGKCDESMKEIIWNVESYRWQSGIIRIVDASSSLWGHINVDDIRFNWDLTYMYRSSTPSSGGLEGGAMMYSGEPFTGAVYAFRRRAASDPKAPCEIDCDEFGCFYLSNPVNRDSCVWQEQQKFQASDRRAYEKFGWSIDVDDDSGIAVVGAVGGRIVDQYNHDDLGGRIRSGAIYLFKRVEETRNQNGVLLEAPYWLPNEQVKIQHVDSTESRNDEFSYSVGIDGRSVIIGAPGKPALNPMGSDVSHFNSGTMQSFPQGGSAFVIDNQIVNVHFTQKEYVVSENHQTLPGSHNLVTIQVSRSGSLNETVYVSYQTSDLTATGVSEAKAAYCLTLDYTVRGSYNCGDYVQQSGILKFDPGDAQVEFELRTMNDLCNEHYSEYVRLQLGIVGGPALIGEGYVATLRIDDDDGDELVNRLFCPEASNPVSKDHPFYQMFEKPDTRGTPARKDPIEPTEVNKWVLEDV